MQPEKQWEQHINVLEWPSQSPDVNRNKSLLHDLKINVVSCSSFCL